MFTPSASKQRKKTKHASMVDIEELFGEREEERLIIPAIEAAKVQGMDIYGPVPPYRIHSS